MASAGCMVCCVAMLLSHYGLVADPKTLNAYLSTHGGYTTSGLLVWESCGGFADGSMRVAYIGEPEYGIIDASLLRGIPVIAKVLLWERYPHWVLIVGKDGAHYLAQDPVGGPGPERVSPRSRYLYSLRILEPSGEGPLLTGDKTNGSDALLGELRGPVEPGPP